MRKSNLYKICEHCKLEFKVYPYRFDVAKFCSKKCSALVVLKTDSFRKLVSDRNKSRGIKPPKFTKHSNETKLKIKASVTKIKTGIKRPNYSGSLHKNWKGGITSQNRKIRNCLEGKQWRRKVLERDAFTCQGCGNKNCKLQVDHELPFALYPDLRFEVLNGRAFCVDCHKKYGWKPGKNDWQKLEMSLKQDLERAGDN